MTADVQSTFRALADPSRRMILMHLTERDMTIAEVADRFAITRAAVRKHLTILEEGALISVHPKGRTRINRLEPMALKSVADWLSYFDGFWNKHLDNLQKVLEQERKPS